MDRAPSKFKSPRIYEASEVKNAELTCVVRLTDGFLDLVIMKFGKCNQDGIRLIGRVVFSSCGAGGIGITCCTGSSFFWRFPRIAILRKDADRSSTLSCRPDTSSLASCVVMSSQSLIAASPSSEILPSITVAALSFDAISRNARCCMVPW